MLCEALDGVSYQNFLLLHWVSSQSVCLCLLLEEGEGEVKIVC